MPRRTNLPGNSAVRGFNRVAVFRSNRNVYNGMTHTLRRLAGANNNNQRRGIKTDYVMHVRHKFPGLLAFNSIKSFDKLKAAYNAARNYTNTSIRRRGNNNNIPMVLSNGRIVINPGNRILN
jgi:hypothetical protein